MTPKAVLLAGALLASSAFADTVDEAARKCEALMAASPAMEHPEMQAALKRPDATPIGIFTKLDELSERGYPNAQYTIAVMHQSGTCVDRDLKLALRYHTLAAEAGVADSLRTLAENYRLGPRAPADIRLGVAEDAVRAYSWYRLLGDRDAMASLKKKLTPLELARGEALAASTHQKRHY